MRLLINSMILVMVLAILVGTVAYRNASTREELDLRVVRDGLDQFQEKLEFHSALWMAEEASVGSYPPQIMPGWFGEGMPKNTLVTGDRPWLDIAPMNDYNDQPPDPLTTGLGQAGFWYNPALGVVRARVPQQDTDRQTLELYNRVNGTSLMELPCSGDPDRVPLALNPNPVTAGQHASPDRRTVGLIEALERKPDTVETAEGKPPVSQEQAPWWDQSGGTAEADPEPELTEAAEESGGRESLLSP
jgi:hypothetical protein